MKQPSLDDHIVKVRAYLTDERFGYEHWRATQFLSPSDARPAILLVFKTEAERDNELGIIETLGDLGVIKGVK